MWWKIGLMCGISAFYLIMISFFGPWFSIHTDYTYCDHQINRDYGLREYSHDYFGHRSGYYYSNVVDDAEYKGMYQVLFATEVLVVSALICTFLFLLLTVLVREDHYKGKYFRTFGFVASILTISSVALFAFAFPPAFEQHMEDRTWLSSVSGFCGASGDSTMDPIVSFWGPGWAWYAMFVAFALNLVGIIILSRTASEEEKDQGEFNGE